MFQIKYLTSNFLNFCYKLRDIEFFVFSGTPITLINSGTTKSVSLSLPYILMIQTHIYTLTFTYAYPT